MLGVEVLEALAGGEAGGADAALAAMGFAGGDLALQAGGQELLVGPALSPGAFGEPLDGGCQRRSLERPGQISQLRSHVAWAARALGCHQPAFSTMPSALSSACSVRPKRRS